MEYGCTLELHSPPRAGIRQELRAFLDRSGLGGAPGVRHTALVRDGAGRIIAAASLEENVVKCVAVDPDRSIVLELQDGIWTVVSEGY